MSNQAAKDVNKILADVHWAGIMLHKPHAHDDPCIQEAKAALLKTLLKAMPEKKDLTYMLNWQDGREKFVHNQTLDEVTNILKTILGGGGNG